MATIYNFAEYATGVPYEWIIRSGGVLDTIVGAVPLYFSFRSPFMRDGDRLDLRAAIRAIPELTVVVSGDGSSGYEVKTELRQVEIDYEILHVADSLRGVSAYPGKPPRINLGSITESLDERVVYYSYLTYNPQYIGRRTLHLEPPSSFGGWGSYIVSRPSPELNRYFPLLRWERERSCPISQMQIHVPRATWDANQDADPPLPPSYEPLDFVVQGNGVISYSYLFGRYDDDIEPARTFFYTEPLNAWAHVGLPGPVPDLLEPLSDSPDPVWL